MKFLKANKYLLLFIATVVVFFAPFYIQGKLPIPTDALAGLYHPWRDSLKRNYPNGYPYKNPLITDPFRQQIPYRKLVIDSLKEGNFPVWNPYAFSGTPLLANIQSAAFYPLNILFWLFKFEIAWSLLVIFEPLLAGIFMFLYLKNLRLLPTAIFLGSVSFAFSGFMVSWMTWNTLGHAALWLPLILLSIDKLLVKFSIKIALLFIYVAVSVIFAGHLQTAFYVIMFSATYLSIKFWLAKKENRKLVLPQYQKAPLFKAGMNGSLSRAFDTGFRTIKQRSPGLQAGESSQNGILFIFMLVVVILISSVQILPIYKFIMSSARSYDLPDWQRPDWFIPFSHLVQFIAPDFFGNPATANYWGVWNYGEFVGYIGLIPLFFSIIGIGFRRDRKTLFYSILLLSSLFIALPTPIGQIPYRLHFPLFETLQPSRILVIIDFCLAVLAALGFDYWQQNQKSTKKQLFIVGFGFSIIFLVLWVVAILGNKILTSYETAQNLLISQRNLILPTIVLCGTLLILYLIYKKNFISFVKLFTLSLLIMNILDMYRFTTKYLPFTDRTLFFPRTESLKFLQENIGWYRLMTTDRRILPPNVTSFYKLQSVDGYDPLYLKNYGELIASWTRGQGDITPAVFNRILTPEKYDVFLAELLGVKYVISLKEEISQKFLLVFQEGETRIYENLDVYPRAFLVEEIQKLPNSQQVIEEMFKNADKLNRVAYTDENINILTSELKEDEFVIIETYESDRIKIQTQTAQERLLILTDTFFPDWRVYINDKESAIFRVDFLLRGVILPKGKSIVEFRI